MLDLGRFLAVYSMHILLTQQSHQFFPFLVHMVDQVAALHRMGRVHLVPVMMMLISRQGLQTLIYLFFFYFISVLYFGEV